MKTKSSHTPGPWRVGDGKYFGYEEIIADDKSCPFPAITSVAKVLQLHDEGKANALLIAAAPLMLQALKEAKHSLDAHSLRRCKWTVQNQEAYELIEAAIAKATGSQK